MENHNKSVHLIFFHFDHLKNSAKSYTYHLLQNLFKMDEPKMEHESIPFALFVITLFYDRRDMLTHIVIHDETIQTRYLPEHM